MLEAWQHLPSNVVRLERNKRPHLSSVLARNEVESGYAYNRALFMRVQQGWYQFNPKLSVRRHGAEEGSWIPIYAALNLPFINEFAWDMGYAVLDQPLFNKPAIPFERSHWIDNYLHQAGLPERTIPLIAEHAIERQKKF